MLQETEMSTAEIMERMETTLGNLEQMSFDSINTTDQLVTLLGKAREYNAVMRNGTSEECVEASDAMGRILDELLNTTFKVNNLSHQLETETVYQRETAESIGQVIDFLYSMADMEM
ncbi:MAG: hypothetical protein J1E62_06920 [Lachnospiraceae bacterium]|nr:hypothetical protein [Lachnospiraceae bacterium]